LSVCPRKGARRQRRIVIARLLEPKIALINAVEAADFPDASIIAQLEVDLRRMARTKG
jgi:hypothetical protein